MLYNDKAQMHRFHIDEVAFIQGVQVGGFELFGSWNICRHILCCLEDEACRICHSFILFATIRAKPEGSFCSVPSAPASGLVAITGVEVCGFVLGQGFQALEHSGSWVRVAQFAWQARNSFQFESTF